MNKYNIVFILLLIFSCKKKEATPLSYNSECNIKNPKNELSWVFKEDYLKWNQLKGSYQYVYYGYLKQSDSKYLSEKGYFKDKNPREVVIIRISNEKRSEIKIDDWILLYQCDGKMITEGWLEEWLSLPKKLSNGYNFDVVQL